MKKIAKMTIVEMQQYAKEKYIQLPKNASKSEILKIIIPYKLKNMTIVELKEFAQKNKLKLPSTKNKSEMLAAITETLSGVITGENYKIILQDNSISERKDFFKKDIDDVQKRKIDDEINDLIESVDMPKNMSADNGFAQNILNSCDNMKKYLLHLIHLETEIDFLKKYLNTLQSHSFQCDNERKIAKKLLREYMDQKNKFEAYNLIGEIEFFRAKLDNPQSYLSNIALESDDIGIRKPQPPKISMPQKPIPPSKPQGIKPLPPTYPIYKKPLFFNKKKVLLENELIKKQYESDLDKYNIATKKYQEEQDLFERAQNAYKTDLDIYKKELNTYNSVIQEYQKELDKYNEIARQIRTQKLISKLEEKIQNAEVQIKSIQAINEDDFNKQVEELPEQAVFKFLSDEQRKVRKEIKETVKIRNQLYSYNIVFDKYRNLIALSSLYEYIDSGRCSSLDGANGAYNLYETELRSNIICSKLDNIAMSLETIKSNQFMLYLELHQINNNLETINQGINDVVFDLFTTNSELQNINYSLNSANESLKSIDNSSQISARNSTATAYNAKVTAYNTAVSAHYSRIISERVDALGFLVAMK